MEKEKHDDVSPGSGHQEQDTESEEDDSSIYLLRCRYCGRDIERYFVYSPIFCPFCGAAINPERLGSRGLERNVLTGRAPWRNKWAVLAVPIIIGIYFGIQLLLTFILLISGLLVHGDVDVVLDFLQSSTGTIILQLAEFSLPVLLLIMLRKFRRPIKERFLLLGWRPYYKEQDGLLVAIRRFGKDLGVGAIYAFAAVGLQFIVIILALLLFSGESPGPSGPGVEETITPESLFDLFILVAGMLLIVGPTEEFLFRGWVQQGLESNNGRVAAILISSLLFTLVHVIQVVFLPLYFLFLTFIYFLLSLFISLVYTKTRNLNVLIFMHGIYDSVLVSISFMVVFNLESMYLVFFVTSIFSFIVVGIFLMISFVRSKRRVKKLNL